MRSRRVDPADAVEKVVGDLGLDGVAKVSRLGSMIRVEVVYDPLQSERESLERFKMRLRRLGSHGDTVGRHLIQQIEYFIERMDRVALERVLVAAASSDGVQRLERQLALLHREMEERRRKAREMKRLVRSFSSYVREYIRNAEGS